MKKRLFIVMFCVMMALVFAACSGGGGETPSSDGGDAPTEETTTPEATDEAATPPAAGDEEAADTGGSKGKVAGVVFQEDQFMKLLQLGYKESAEKAGYEFFPGNTNSDAAKEVEFINTYITQGFKGLAISPISEEASIKPLSDAADKGLIIGLSNSNLGSEPWMIACYTSDNYELGNLTGKECAKFIEEKMGGKAKIGILQFKSLLPEQSAARSDGFKDALKDLPGVEIVADQDAWLQDKAITMAGDMLTANSDINLLWSANEGGTIGATMAIQNAGLAGKVYCFGTDASEQTINMILADDDILQAVTGQDPYNIGIMTMQAVIDTIEGKEVADKGKTVIVPGVVLSRADTAAVEAFKADFMAKTGS
jgi:ABC-type sugar transport system substrate-binding protein